MVKFCFCWCLFLLFFLFPYCMSYSLYNTQVSSYAVLWDIPSQMRKKRKGKIYHLLLLWLHFQRTVHFYQKKYLFTFILSVPHFKLFVYFLRPLLNNSQRNEIKYEVKERKKKCERELHKFSVKKCSCSQGNKW